VSRNEWIWKACRLLVLRLWVVVLMFQLVAELLFQVILSIVNLGLQSVCVLLLRRLRCPRWALDWRLFLVFKDFL
jgi:hypothetical protein